MNGYSEVHLNRGMYLLQNIEEVLIMEWDYSHFSI